MRAVVVPGRRTGTLHPAAAADPPDPSHRVAHHGIAPHRPGDVGRIDSAPSTAAAAAAAAAGMGMVSPTPITHPSPIVEATPPAASAVVVVRGSVVGWEERTVHADVVVVAAVVPPPPLLLLLLVVPAPHVRVAGRRVCHLGVRSLPLLLRRRR